MADMTRREFLKITGATLAASSLVAMGFSPTPALAEVRQFKLARATETRNTCPYCSVACGVLMYSLGDNAKNAQPNIFHIEGDPDHPVNRGTLCPKGAGLIDFIHSESRLKYPEYRAPGSDKWEEKPLDWMYEQIAKRYYDTREKHFIEQEKDKDGNLVTVNRLEAIASLGSACIDNEECYLLSKLNRTYGIVYHEHQARV